MLADIDESLAVIKSDLENALNYKNCSRDFAQKFHIAHTILASQEIDVAEIKKKLGLRRPDVVNSVLQDLINAGILEKTEEGFSREKYYAKLYAKVKTTDLKTPEDVQPNLTDEEIEDLKRILGDYYLRCIAKAKKWKFESIIAGRRITKTDYQIVLEANYYVRLDENKITRINNCKSKDDLKAVAEEIKTASTDNPYAPDFGGSSFSDDNIPF